MNYPIIPYESVGQIRFGMSRSEVRATLNSDFRSLMKSRYSELPMDHFLRLAIQVFYRAPDICQAVEISLAKELSGPAVPTLNGQELLGVEFRYLVEYLRTHDTAIEINSTGVRSKLFGIALYVPDLPGSDAIVKSVNVFERNYYERERMRISQMPDPYK